MPACRRRRSRCRPRAKNTRVYFEVNSAPYAAGEVSFIGETLTRLGVRNIVPASLGPFPKLNPEFVVRADPDLIMVGERSAQGLEQRPGLGAASGRCAKAASAASRPANPTCWCGPARAWPRRRA